MDGVALIVLERTVFDYGTSSPVALPVTLAAFAVLIEHTHKTNENNTTTTTKKEMKDREGREKKSNAMPGNSNAIEFVLCVSDSREPHGEYNKT